MSFIISRSSEDLVHKTSLTQSFYYFIEFSVPSHECKRSRICVLGILKLPLSIIFPLDFGNVPRVMNEKRTGL